MRILGIDTATEACSVALLQDGRLLGRYEELGAGHAERILGMLDAVLGEAGVTLKSLDGIAADIGPGAFTGVRIAVAVAQGLAFGAGLPLVPVTSLEALALRARHGGAARSLACLDARMGEVYWACYAADAARGVVATTTPAVCPPAAVRLPAGGQADPGRVAGVGRGFAVYPELALLPGLELGAADRLALPDARQVAELGALRLAAGEGLDPADLRPLYVRDKIARTEAERARG